MIRDQCFELFDRRTFVVLMFKGKVGSPVGKLNSFLKNKVEPRERMMKHFGGADIGFKSYKSKMEEVKEKASKVVAVYIKT